MSGEAQLKWEARWHGRRVQVVVQQGSEVAHSDTVDPASAKSRQRMLEHLTSQFPGIPKDPIEQRLLAMASEGPPSTDATAMAVDADPEPWPEPVNGNTLLNEIRGVLERYVILPAHAAVAIALWILHCYAFDRFQHTPRLLIHSPDKRCGKSLLTRLIDALVPRALSCENITAAALFRSIEKFKPTLLIDEADTLLRGKNVQEDLRGILNAGFSKGGGVLRCVGDDHEPVKFDVFAPVVLAMIGKPPATIEDRAIAISMRRKTRQETVERVPPGANLRKQFLPTVQQCIRWGQDHSEGLAESKVMVPEALDDRAADCWFPLLALADAIDEGWGERARAAALALSAGRDEAGASLNIDLLTDLRAIFDSSGDDQLPTARIIKALQAIEERPWADFANGRGFGPYHLAGHLRPFDIRPVNIRIGGKIPKGYRRADLETAWERYLPAPSPPAATAATPLHPAPTRLAPPSSRYLDPLPVLPQYPHRSRSGSG